MGYAVYKDLRYPNRWAGYAVPAECEWPDCKTMIYRGFGHKCETHSSFEVEFEDGDIVGEAWTEEEGCGLYFCVSHRHLIDQHALASPKPDHPEWLWWMLVAPSWRLWRLENPEEASRNRKIVEESGWRPSKANMEDLFSEMESESE